MQWAEMAPRLRQAMGEMTQEQLAGRIHKDQSTVNLYLKGKRRPSPETLAAMAKLLGVSSDYLLGLTDMAQPGEQRTVVEYRIGDNEKPEVREMVTAGIYSANDAPPLWIEIAGSRFLPVPKLRDPVAAGFGIVSTGATDGIQLFREDELRRDLTGQLWPGRVVAIDVADWWLGESMLPTIEPGAALLADRGPDPLGLTEFRDGSIYVVRTDKGVTCKRVWLTGKTLNCHADNRQHPPEVVPLRGKPLSDYVLARVFRISNPQR